MEGRYTQRVAKTYTAVETFHSQREREDRIIELEASDISIFRIKKSVAFDIQDAFLLEYSICMT